jgi:hypothetical protein
MASAIAAAFQSFFVILRSVPGATSSRHAHHLVVLPLNPA